MVVEKRIMTTYSYNGFTISGEFNQWRIFKGNKQPFATKFIETFNSEQACKNIIDSSNAMKKDLGKSFKKFKSLVSEEYENGSVEREREEEKVNNYFERINDEK